MYYLYIKNHNLDEKISYYIITSWAYNEKKNIFIFYKKKDKEVETYNININNIEYDRNISEHLKHIINDHIDYIEKL